MNKEFLKMQKLAGVITESQYNQKKDLIKEVSISGALAKVKDKILNSSLFNKLIDTIVSKMSDKEGKLLTDQLSVPGLEELYSSEEDLEKITYDVLYSTNLPIEDYTAEEAEEYVRERFPYASIDVMSGDYEVDKNENLYDAERDLS